MDGPTRIFRTQQTPVLRGFIDFPPTRFRFCFSSSLALSPHVLRSRELFLSFILFLSRSDSFEMEKKVPPSRLHNSLRAPFFSLS